MSFNKITIIGNLGRDPELRYTPQGDAVCTFSVAVNDKKRDKTGELQDITTWFRVTLWRKLGENAAKYLTKGKQVYIEGRLHVEEYTDKDGNNRYSLEVTASDMQFLGSISDSNDGGGNQNAQPRQAKTLATAVGKNSSDNFQNDEFTGENLSQKGGAVSDDDIPF